MSPASISFATFIPLTSNLWNDLPQSIRTIERKQTFKNSLRNIILITPTLRIKCYLNHRPRKTNILHCKLRNRASALNYDLFCAHLSNNPSCDCGFVSEDINHFFFYCPRYHQNRIILLNELYWYSNLSIETIKYGDPNLDEHSNIKLCTSVQKYIVSSKRFAWSKIKEYKLWIVIVF